MEDNSKNISINITTGAVFKMLLIILFFYILYILLDLVLIVLTAVVLASAIEPATKWFARYKIPRIPAVIIVYAIMAISVIGIFYFFIPPLLDEASKLSAVLPKYMETIMVPETVKGNFFGAEKIVGDLTRTISFGDIILQAKNAVSGLSGGVFGAINMVFGGAFSFIMIIVISFYLAVQENGISNFLKLVTPIRQQKYVIDLWKRSQIKIGRWMQGQLLLGLIIGILVYLGLTILKVPYALLLAILAAVFELIPIFGPILAAIPAIILGFVDGGLTMGALITGFYIIIQQFENHLIYPLVVRKVLGVPPLLVILALIIGGKLAGFLGILLSVPAAAALIEFTNDIAREKKIF
jgi:predicted PurR-regulated permease PerM